MQKFVSCHHKTLSLAQAVAGLEITACIDLFEQGLAIITVLKAGFLFSGRVGSGLVIARKSDGCASLSSPAVILRKNVLTYT